MGDITVGQVSGIIAFGITIVQISIPIAIIVVLIGVVKNENTVATWTTASRAIQSSLWPTILNFNVPLSKRLDGKVEFLTYLTPAALLLVALAGIITPLGLYDEIVADSNPSQASYEVVNDDSAFGYGTPPRSANFRPSRICGGLDAVPCPYTDTIFIDNGTDTVAPYNYDSKIPKRLVDTFSSDPNSLVSGVWDIQWRQYTETKDPLIENGTAYTRGFHRHLRTVLLDDEVSAVQGLIVDTRNGGVAFRNHSLPVGQNEGATWTESLMFVEPVTQCVDTNLTLEFELDTLGFKVQVNESSLLLTDRGGFVNLERRYPVYDHDNAQDDPDLRSRAYKAAWLNNAITMLYLNITTPQLQQIDSKIGKQFQLPKDTIRNFKHNAVKVGGKWGSYLQLESSLNRTLVNGVGAGNFSDISILCSGAGQGDKANITNIAVTCGLIIGAPVPVDGPPTLIFRDKSKWKAPLYSCATAVRATVRNFDLKINGTSSDLKSLGVTGFKDSDQPRLWAVEETAYNNSDLSPLWGIVPNTRTAAPTNTVRKQSLWLPGYATNSFILSGTYDKQNLPGADFYRFALSIAYNVDPTLPDPDREIPDYSGRGDLSIFARWQNLTSKADTAAKMVNLIWTDVAANSVMGSKGIVESAANAAPGVYVYHKRIRYKYLYAIPAAILLVLWFAILVLATGCCAARRTTRKKMKYLINHTATGNVVASFLAEGYNVEDTAKESMIKHGDMIVGLRHRGNAAFGRAYAPVQQDSKGEKNKTGEGDGEIQEISADITPRNDGSASESKAWYRVR